MKFVTGDITYVEHGIICQQVNCMNAYGKGVSGAISGKWPKVEREYRKFCEKYSPQRSNPENLFGRTQIIPITSDLLVANIFSQVKYGNSEKDGICYTDMDILTDSLKSLLDTYGRSNDVYVPDHIGCALAGGNWDEFLNRMDKTNLVVVKFNGKEKSVDLNINNNMKIDDSELSL